MSWLSWVQGLATNAKGLSPGSYFDIGSSTVDILGSLLGGLGSGKDNLSAFNALSGVRLNALGAQQQAIENEALAQEAQAKLAVEEAGLSAEQAGRAAGSFRKEQANAFNASGVLLEGSPLLVLEETRKLGQQEIDAITKRGSAQAELLMSRANFGRNEGRAALLGSNIGYGTNKAQAGAESAANKRGLSLGFLKQLFPANTTQKSLLGSAAGSNPFFSSPPGTIP